MSLIKTLLICIILFTGLSSCSKVQLIVSFSPESQKLRDGEKEFERGNFQHAETLFLEIYDSDTTPQIRNNALYNLACTRIITAEDSTEYLAAIHLLERWQQSYPSVVYIENPNIMIQALKGRSVIIKNDIEAMKQERDTALSQMDEQKERLSRQNLKIAELTRQLKASQHQIQELEAIDHQLQKIKNPL